MATITPTSDTNLIIDRTALRAGDLVARLSTGLPGRILGVNFEGQPSQVLVRWDDGSTSAAQTLDLRRL